MKAEYDVSSTGIQSTAVRAATYAMGVLRWMDQRSTLLVIAIGVIDVSLDNLGAPASVVNGFYVLAMAIVLPLIWMQLSRFARFLIRRNA